MARDLKCRTTTPASRPLPTDHGRMCHRCGLVQPADTFSEVEPFRLPGETTRHHRACGVCVETARLVGAL